MLWVSSLQRKPSGLLRDSGQVITIPCEKKEKPQTDAHKLGIRKEGMGGAAWLLLVILNSIGESYRP